MTPDPGRLFLTDGHRDAIGAILYGLGARKGFIAVTGDAGVGKTTVLRHCLAQLPADYDIVYVLQPALPPAELFRLLYRELSGKFGEPLPPGWDGISSLVSAVHAELFSVFDRGRSVVVVIDEAQNMPAETLESLRVLSNLETDTEKLLQIVLVGQSELDRKLARHELRQLDQRIAVRAHIAALSRAQSLQYIDHRLRLVGGATADFFTDHAISLIVRAGRGNPRRLNVLCDNALMNGCGHRAAKVSKHIAGEVVSQLRERPRWRGVVWRSGAMLSQVFGPPRRREAVAPAATGVQPRPLAPANGFSRERVSAPTGQKQRVSAPRSTIAIRPAAPRRPASASPAMRSTTAPSSPREPVDAMSGVALPQKTIGFSF